MLRFVLGSDGSRRARSPLPTFSAFRRSVLAKLVFYAITSTEIDASDSLLAM